MTHREPAAAHRSPSSVSSSPASDHLDALAGAEVADPKLGITIYGCALDEGRLFRQRALCHGIVPTITDAAVSETNVELAFGNRCISVGHKSRITHRTVLTLRRAGVRYISTRSVGYDHIDVTYAKSVGVCVETVAYSPESVADFTLMLILMAVRNAKSTMSRVEAHDYRLSHLRGKELRDMTVGVIGTGRIGGAVIERLRGFGCQVLANDRWPKGSADYVPLDQLLQESDVVTLHTPLHADTHHLLNRQRLEQMRHGAFVVNTGRGGLLDTEALVLALESGRLGGAALDVLEGEDGVFYTKLGQRPIENQLLVRLQRLPNVLITPHIAYYTDHALRDVVENTLIGCMRFLEEDRHG